MTTFPGGHILIVEDHEGTRQSLAYILHQAGHTVSQAADADEAIARIAATEGGESGYDVVLTDLLLEHATGIEVLKAARSLPYPPEVILLTGYGTMSSAIDALRQDAFDYLLKPCVPEALLQSIARALAHRRELLQQRQAISAIEANLQLLRSAVPHIPTAARPAPAPPASRSAQIGKLVIDQAAHTISFDGQMIQATPTEYAIVAFLAANANALVTYQELARQIYGQDLTSYEAHQLLKTHIHNLRSKISRAYLVNVRGAGYRLVNPEG